VQKADTAKASSSKVNFASVTPEDLVHLVDVSVASKYGTDLAQFTRAMGEDVHITLDSFRRDLDGSFPRQIQSIMKEVMVNMQGKQVPDTTIAPQATPPCGGGTTMVGRYHNTPSANPNL
jgi:hypothetical protein